MLVKKAISSNQITVLAEPLRRYCQSKVDGKPRNRRAEIQRMRRWLWHDWLRQCGPKHLFAVADGRGGLKV
jgi:hypothetical protein